MLDLTLCGLQLLLAFFFLVFQRTSTQVLSKFYLHQEDHSTYIPVYLWVELQPAAIPFAPLETSLSTSSYLKLSSTKLALSLCVAWRPFFGWGMGYFQVKCFLEEGVEVLFFWGRCSFSSMVRFRRGKRHLELERGNVPLGKVYLEWVSRCVFEGGRGF